MISKGSEIVNIRTGQRMIFLNTWAETNGTRLEIECFSPPAIAREHEHIHPFQENRFSILSGKLTFSINGKEFTANEGEVISIPRKVPHYFWNADNKEAHYIQEFFPALNIDKLFETFFALARDGKLYKNGAPNLFRLSLIMLAHQKELRLTKPSWRTQKIIFIALSFFAKILGYKSQYQ